MPSIFEPVLIEWEIIVISFPNCRTSSSSFTHMAHFCMYNVSSFLIGSSRGSYPILLNYNDRVFSVSTKHKI